MTRKVLPPAIGLAAVLLTGVVAWERGDIIVKSDPGGAVAALYGEYYQQWQAGRRHVIDGRCASSCTMRLAFDTTCVTPNARLGFHKAYYASFFGWKIESDWGTNYMLERYPPIIIDWLNDQGGISHDMKWLSGQDAMVLGVPAC
jgi:hypothetical protein